MTIETASAGGHVEFLNPDGLNQNPAFSNVAVVSGTVRTIYVGGQDAVDADGNVVGIGDVGVQTEQVLRNLMTAFAAAGAGPEHVVKWNVLIAEGHDFAPGYAAFQKVWGNGPNPPVITVAIVKSLAHPGDSPRILSDPESSERPSLMSALRRVGAKREVAATAVFHAGPGSAFITAIHVSQAPCLPTSPRLARARSRTVFRIRVVVATSSSSRLS